MAQRLNALAMQIWQPEFSPWTPQWEERMDSQRSTSDLQRHTMACASLHIHTYTQTKIKIKQTVKCDSPTQQFLLGLSFFISLLNRASGFSKTCRLTVFSLLTRPDCYLYPLISQRQDCWSQKAKSSSSNGFHVSLLITHSWAWPRIKQLYSRVLYGTLSKSKGC